MVVTCISTRTKAHEHMVTRAQQIFFKVKFLSEEVKRLEMERDVSVMSSQHIKLDHQLSAEYRQNSLNRMFSNSFIGNSSFMNNNVKKSSIWSSRELGSLNFRNKLGHSAIASGVHNLISQRQITEEDSEIIDEDDMDIDTDEILDNWWI